MNHRLSKAMLFFVLIITLLLPVFSKGTAIQALSSRQEKKTSDSVALEAAPFPCLPETLSLSEIVSYRHMRNDKEEGITIKDKLVEMKAQCKNGKLVDSRKREIKFFRSECFGNPPADYLEIQQKKRDELEKLQKQYTVIIIECNPRIQ